MKQSQEIQNAIANQKLTYSDAVILETLILEDVEESAKENQLLNICGR